MKGEEEGKDAKKKNELQYILKHCKQDEKERTGKRSEDELRLNEQGKSQLCPARSVDKQQQQQP